MKRSLLIFMTVFMLSAANASAGTNAAANVEQTAGSAAQADTVVRFEEPITKTVVMDEEDAPETKPRNKWITAGLVLFGIVGFFFLKTMRKKKPVKKETDLK